VLWGGGDNVLESMAVMRFFWLPRKSCSVPMEVPPWRSLLGVYSPTLKESACLT